MDSRVTTTAPASGAAWERGRPSAPVFLAVSGQRDGTLLSPVAATFTMLSGLIVLRVNSVR